MKVFDLLLNNLHDSCCLPSTWRSVNYRQRQGTRYGKRNCISLRRVKLAIEKLINLNLRIDKAIIDRFTWEEDLEKVGCVTVQFRNLLQCSRK